MHENHDRPELWVPDNEDGSGWANVDWASVSQGSRYHYQHGEPLEVAEAIRAPFYKVVTRLETERIIPHENTYYVTGSQLADFVGELVWHGGDEVIWHIEPCDQPPDAAHVR
jgi:hypothetical protein